MIFNISKRGGGGRSATYRNELKNKKEPNQNKKSSSYGIWHRSGFNEVKYGKKLLDFVYESETSTIPSIFKRQNNIIFTFHEVR